MTLDRNVGLWYTLPKHSSALSQRCEHTEGSMEITELDVPFIRWVKGELIRRGWSQNTLIRRSGLSNPSVSNVITGKRKPGRYWCESVAHAFGMHPEVVLRRAGILGPLPEADMRRLQLRYIFDQLNENDQQSLLAQAEAVAELRGRETCIAENTQIALQERDPEAE